MSKKILLSGVQASGKPHIGNYFGALKQFVDLQADYECFIMIADYHALHSLRNPKEMSENIKNVLLDYLAIGLDPKVVTLFKESDVGTFNYPVLMAADILLYSPDIVPVGADQKQHVEIARDIAEKFNYIYGDTFKLPEHKIMEDVAVVPGTDGRKMSKSYGNTIPLFAEYEEIKKCVMGIVTDSSGELPKNVFAIHKLLRPESELKKIYEEKAGKYKELKELLIEDLEKFIAPMRDRRKEFAKDPAKAIEILKNGGKKAKEIASKKMDEVRDKVGVKI